MASTRRRLEPRKQPRQVRAELTRDRIAEAAGVSIGSLYQYYPNKDAILVELMTVHVNAGMAATRRHLAGRLPDSLEETLRLFVRATIENHLDRPELHRVLFEEAPRPPTFLQMTHRAEDSIVVGTQSLLADHPEVTVTDTHTAAAWSSRPSSRWYTGLSRAHNRSTYSASRTSSSACSTAT